MDKLLLPRPLKEFAVEAINIDRVILMLLIHDLGEIDAGDTIIYASETADNKAKEEAGVKRVLDMLPTGQGDEYLALWQEFELGETADSRYARAIDRIPPLLHNLQGEGHSWKDSNVPKEKVFDLNSRIAKGSAAVWDVLKGKLEEAVDVGLLK